MMEVLAFAFMPVKFFECPVGLSAIPKRHNDEILVVALGVCIEAGIALPSSDRSAALDQPSGLHVLCKALQRRPECIDVGFRAEVEAGKHVKHRGLSIVWRFWKG